MDSNFSSAKNIVDFYMNKLSEDIENKEAIFALQWANLHILKLRTNSTLNTLESYDIEV